MKIRGLMMDPVTSMPIVILKDVGSNNVLPIWVGIYEANAIALEIEKVSTPRPMTHDLIKTLLLGLDAGIRKVVVNELREDTFFALIWVERNGELISVDSRPSDALALALRLDCPIYVDDSVLKSAKSAANVSDKLNTNSELQALPRKSGRRRPRPLQDVSCAEPHRFMVINSQIAYSATIEPTATEIERSRNLAFRLAISSSSRRFHQSRTRGVSDSRAIS